jgi:putative serine protease PepD
MRKIAVLLVMVAALGACTLEAVQDAAGVDDETATTGVDLDQNETPPPRSPVADIVSAALPSVVNVKVETGGGAGEGSGVVIDRNGTILTNFHVVECSVDVRVVFNDDVHPRMNGTVVGGIPEKDLAIIKVNADDLTPIELGSSSRLRLGDEVIAIGFPLSLGTSPTVTKGIVSALDRSIEATGADPTDPRALDSLLQTDAAINPGNSGGALIDRGGRLVGINTAAASAGTAENIGFAIQIDDALPAIEEILSEPPGERAWLGVGIAPIESSVAAQEFGVDPDVRGAGVLETFRGDPAEGAGIETGEVIVRVGDEPVESGSDLTRALAGLSPGDEVEIELVSDDGTRTVTVRLGTRPPTICE